MTEPAPEGLPDLVVIPYAEALLECLCDQLAGSLGGPVCDCCLRPGGGLPPMDNCGCGCGESNGQASVQIGSIYPTAKFPRTGIDAWNGPCGQNVTWAADLVMTVYRCVHSIDEQGKAPSCEQLAGDAQIIAADAAAMRRAFACCDWAANTRIIPGTWVAVPPQGGCAGGFMTVTVDLGVICCRTDGS